MPLTEEPHCPTNQPKATPTNQLGAAPYSQEPHQPILRDVADIGRGIGECVRSQVDREMSSMRYTTTLLEKEIRLREDAMEKYYDSN